MILTQRTEWYAPCEKGTTLYEYFSNNRTLRLSKISTLHNVEEMSFRLQSRAGALDRYCRGNFLNRRSRLIGYLNSQSGLK